MKTRTPSLAQGTESDSHDKHMHDRQLYLLTHLVVSLLHYPRITGIDKDA